jgi:hypothetical protein
MKRIGTVLALALLALAVPTAAQAATPGNATKAIAKCMKHAGAKRVSNHGSKGGKAYFAGPFDATNVHYVQWSYFFVDDGQVKATATASVGLTRRQERAVNRCLRPYGGSV